MNPWYERDPFPPGDLAPGGSCGPGGPRRRRSALEARKARAERWDETSSSNPGRNLQSTMYPMSSLYVYIYIHMYVYIYIYMGVSSCFFGKPKEFSQFEGPGVSLMASLFFFGKPKHAHFILPGRGPLVQRPTNIHIYIYEIAGAVRVGLFRPRPLSRSRRASRTARPRHPARDPIGCAHGTGESYWFFCSMIFPWVRKKGGTSPTKKESGKRGKRQRIKQNKKLLLNPGGGKHRTWETDEGVP